MAIKAGFPYIPTILGRREGAAYLLLWPCDGLVIWEKAPFRAWELIQGIMVLNRL